MAPSVTHDPMPPNFALPTRWAMLWYVELTICADGRGISRVNEKQAIEKGTAEGFLALYNQLLGTDFKVVEIADAPDARCADSRGVTLNLEITTTEDRLEGIKSLLGRSNDRSLEALRAHNDRVATGEEQAECSDLTNEVSDTLIDRLQAKLRNDYGPNVALVVRDTSGVDWDWDPVIPAIRSRLKIARNPFSRGIWLLSREKNRLFQIV